MKISLTIPVYKAEAYIERCARSLFEQTHADMEYIFINDNTPDKSLEVLQKVLSDYPHRKAQVKVVSLPKSLGPGEARRLGLSMASGDYVGFCDSDDWIDLDYVGKMSAKAAAENADIVYGPIVREFPDGKRVELNVSDYKTAEELILKSCPSVLFNSMCNKLIRRTLAAASGIEVLEGVSIGEDLYFITQVAMKASRVASVKDAIYHYRQNYGSITQKGLGPKRPENLLQVTEKLEKRLEGETFAPVRDRLRRDVLAASFTARTFGDSRFAALRRRLESPLFSDARYGLVKRAILVMLDLVFWRAK